MCRFLTIIHLSSNVNIYISAYFANSVNKLPVSITVGNRTITGPATYVAKYSDAGEIQWVQTLDKGFASSHKTDAEGNSYICGSFQDFYNLGTFYKQSNGSNDVFVTKFSKDGDILWLETLGGSNNDFVNGITLDKGKNFYVSGSFSGVLNYKDKKLTQIGPDPDSFILRLDK